MQSAALVRRWWITGLVLAAAAPFAAAQENITSGLTIPAGASVTIEVDVEVASSLSDQVTVHQVCAQAEVSGTGFTTVDSDDPETATAGDSTCTSLPDYGDAPNDGSTTFYPTLAVDNGAVHALGSGIFLGNAGTSLDTDSDGQPTGFADGDDTDGNNDDDGVTFASAINPGSNATVDVTASSACGSVTCYLNAWMDFDGDGTWDDTGEQIFTDQVVTSGLNSGLTYAVPVGATGNSNTYTRFRVSTDSGLSYTGLASNGEVEDYLVTTVPVELMSFDVE